MNLLAFLAVILVNVFGLIRIVINHKLAVSKVITIHKEFPSASIEEVMHASEILSSIDRTKK